MAKLRIRDRSIESANTKTIIIRSEKSQKLYKRLTIYKILLGASILINVAIFIKLNS